ncbi:hypothetical protein [Escherichia coli]|uniref:hypothetical protein n=1 Tax=Escherichia coli TaxID=562 RepID=UPI000A5A7C4B|nr:hypothetical protein [Escherichia coli]
MPSAHDSADHSHSEVQTRVLNMFREALPGRRIGYSYPPSTPLALVSRCVSNGLLYPVATLSRDEGISWLMTIYQSMSDLSDNMFKAYMPQDARLKQEFLQAVKLFGGPVMRTSTRRRVSLL